MADNGDASSAEDQADLFWPHFRNGTSFLYQKDYLHRVKREAQNVYWNLLTTVETQDQRDSEKLW